MNSQDFRNLQESYMGVYDDDIREKLEFESWVNSLIEEGYDLSDYTWDELYESYFDEGYKDLPRLRMAGQSLKKLRRGFEGARTAINSGETKDTSGGQIAAQRSMKDVTQAQKIINKSLPGGHSKEKAQTKEKFNKSVGEFAKKDPELAASIRKKMNKESHDLYDLILSHLIDEGYADTQEAAERIMVNMSEDWKESIVETRMDPRGRPASGPMNVYANPKGKPSQARLDAIAAVEADNKKKTPEQRKKELDDYRERQMNNK